MDLHRPSVASGAIQRSRFRTRVLTDCAGVKRVFSEVSGAEDAARGRTQRCLKAGHLIDRLNRSIYYRRLNRSEDSGDRKRNPRSSPAKNSYLFYGH